MDDVEIHRLLDEMIEQQETKVRVAANRVAPHLTAEDLLQPHDFAELRGNGEFNFEDGILAGLRAVQIALRAAARRAEAGDGVDSRNRREP